MTTDDTMIIDTAHEPHAAIDPGLHTLTIVECGSEIALAWLAEELEERGATFGTEVREGDRPRVIVLDADLDVRLRLQCYGLLTTWRSHLPLTGTYTPYGLEARAL